MSRRRPACLVCYAEEDLETVTQYPDGWRGVRRYVCSAGPGRLTTCQLVLIRRDEATERRAIREATTRDRAALDEGAARDAAIVAEGDARDALLLEESAEGRRPHGETAPPWLW